MIENDILKAIMSRKIKPGEKLPTEQEYMEKYQVSRITVSNAMTKLAKQNIISRYPKRGSFVNELEAGTDFMTEERKRIYLRAVFIMNQSCDQEIYNDKILDFKYFNSYERRTGAD